MANLYYLNDHGNTIFRDLDQKIYTKVGTRNDVQPNAQWVPGSDVGNITGYTFTTADPQGTTIYTDEQMAVIENLYFVKFDPIGSGWQTAWASAPVSGVLRYCERAGYGGTLRINGGTSAISYAGGGSTNIRVGSCQAVNISAGDLIEVSGTAGNSRIALGILPFVWPIV